MNNQIQLYTSADGKISLQVSLDNETVWLTQLQMSELFGTTPENVLMHLKNIYKEQEIDEILTTKDFLVVRQEGIHCNCHHTAAGLPRRVNAIAINVVLFTQGFD